MIKLNYRKADSALIGIENGLNIAEEFASYSETIKNIITRLRKH